MLKSRFKLGGFDEEEEPQAEREQEPDIKLETELLPGEEEAQEEGSDIEIPPDATENGKVLNRSEVSTRLSMIGKTADGDGYTYLKGNLTEMKLIDITVIKQFKHLQFLNFSRNLLTIEALQPITELPHLILIQADVNLITSPVLKKMKYLQVIIMNHNKITSVKNVYHHYLSTLELAHNKIKEVSFDNNLPHIKVLDFRYNVLRNISKLNFITLDSLYVAANKIRSLKGLENMPNLRIVHARDNPLGDLDGFCAEHTKLIYINIRNTKINSLKELRKLKDLEALETLNLKGTPYMKTDADDKDSDSDDEQTRIDILAMLQRLKKINKTMVTPEERHQSKKLLVQWILEGKVFDEDVGEEEEKAE